MRPMHLVIQEINRKLTIERVAGELRISEAQVYKLGQPWAAGESGRPPTLEQGLAYLRMAAAANLPETDELVGFFTQAARVKTIGQDLVAHFNRGVAALNDGGKLNERPDAMNCHVCGQRRQLDQIDGSTALLRCRNPICTSFRQGL